MIIRALEMLAPARDSHGKIIVSNLDVTTALDVTKMRPRSRAKIKSELIALAVNAGFVTDDGKYFLTHFRPTLIQFEEMHSNEYLLCAGQHFQSFPVEIE